MIKNMFQIYSDNNDDESWVSKLKSFYRMEEIKLSRLNYYDLNHVCF